MIAGSACYTSARSPKGLKPTQRMQAKPGAAPKSQGEAFEKGEALEINAGLHKAEYEGTKR